MAKIRFKHFLFTENKKRPDTYDLTVDKTSSKDPPFKFVRLDEPREDYLLKRGAEYVMQSFKGNKKILHTGLVPFYNNFYYGDVLKDNDKKDFLIVLINSENKTVRIFIIPNRNPRNKEDFAFDFLKNLAENQ